MAAMASGVGDRLFRGVVRVHAHGAPDIRLRLGQCRQHLRLASVVPIVTISPTPAAAARASTSGRSASVK